MAKGKNEPIHPTRINPSILYLLFYDFACDYFVDILRYLVERYSPLLDEFEPLHITTKNYYYYYYS
jgi:hypothetical protein